jgi:Zn-dependent protease with chaperone function/Zn-finger nucleic acid-binding protein
MDGAPTTFFDVERERRWRIWLLFATLAGLFFAAVWVVTFCVAGAAASVLFDTRAYWLTFTAPGLAALLTGSLLAAWLYWRVSRIGADARLLAAMHARPLDPDDRYHRRLRDIVEEMAIAGGCPRLRCVVVPTVGMNAFTFSDFEGGGTIGVTEGALARLTRQQLEGVVAHEVAHVLGGDCRTVTAACLLFGVYSSAAGGLGAVRMGIDGDTDPGRLPSSAFLLQGVLAVGLQGVFATLALATALVDSALSREREYRADAAAVRYTRDPLSLAQALALMERHPAGAGYLAPGLAALCIRPAGSGESDWFSRLDATHPPTERRIAVLLGFAGVSPQAFAVASLEAEDALAKREHVAAPPATRPLAAGAGLEGVVAVPPQQASAGQTPGAAVSPSGDMCTAGDTCASGRARTAAAAGNGGSSAAPACPSCGASLRPVDYEGLTILSCSACGGRLVSSSAAAKILARREVGFSDEQRRLAVVVAQEGDHLRRQAVLARGRHETSLAPCPLCGKTMLRRHYDLQSAVEVDVCLVCDRIWFQKDELEVLQILVEGLLG